jgi:hypothetical protein
MSAAEFSIGLSRDSFGRLVLALPGGDKVIGVVPVRCFPFTAPGNWVSFCDEGGREVHCLHDTSALPPTDRELLEQELARREFMPRVRRIRSVSPGAEPTLWQVDTDRGETSFTLTSEDHIRRFGSHGMLICDEHGVRYRIDDVRSLDAHSRRILVQYP